MMSILFLVSEFTRHEPMSSQTLIRFRSGSQEGLDDSFSGHRGQAV
ncbi:hypothetical protein F443_22333 [Phytophthora nicotianae P1569]|uniref:Uncharacterized protein n=1 Tax=Phytophthora nicotianae P1569 TaxID=1317065 RepID=V9DV81_PHYNI|nr:hypothetical protein F443_22333 [Phytophthora nicotianae P1569]